MEARQQAQPYGRYALAFEELGLDWHWDGSEPVRAYIEREHPHLLRVFAANLDLDAVLRITTRAAA